MDMNNVDYEKFLKKYVENNNTEENIVIVKRLADVVEMSSRVRSIAKKILKHNLDVGDFWNYEEEFLDVLVSAEDELGEAIGRALEKISLRDKLKGYIYDSFSESRDA